jgi:serine/threonine-protein phosphatase 4 regulatory subunit 1
MHNVCRVAGERAIAELLPAYVRLTRDDYYRVRKACAESIVFMSKALPEDVRCESLAEVFDRFVADSSKYVRNAAFQQLGPFIATLPASSVSAELLGHFTSMANGTGDATIDNEMRLYCAFSFPAVLLTVGADR